jgi:hypothetical protein
MKIGAANRTESTARVRELGLLYYSAEPRATSGF